MGTNEESFGLLIWTASTWMSSKPTGSTPWQRILNKMCYSKHQMKYNRRWKKMMMMIGSYRDLRTTSSHLSRFRKAESTSKTQTWCIKLFNQSYNKPTTFFITHRIMVKRIKIKWTWWGNLAIIYWRKNSVPLIMFQLLVKFRKLPHNWKIKGKA